MRYLKDGRTVRVTLSDFKGSKTVGKSVTFSIYETTKEEVRKLLEEAIDKSNKDQNESRNSKTHPE